MSADDRPLLDEQVAYYRARAAVESALAAARPAGDILELACGTGLGTLGWTADVRGTKNFFIYGRLSPGSRGV